MKKRRNNNLKRATPKIYVTFHIYHMTGSHFRRKREVKQCDEAKCFFGNEMNKNTLFRSQNIQMFIDMWTD